MPVMGDWSDRLCRRLDEAESKLAGAVHLQPGLSGEEFETALGAFLRWRDAQPLSRHFANLCGPHPGSHYSGAMNALDAGERRARLVVDVLHRSLYDEFGAARINADLARGAYGGLLELLPDPESVVFVTTNYDAAAEIGLDALGKQVATGFPSQQGRTPVLSPEGMVDWEGLHGGRVPVLHLHGAVGWYERDGTVVSEYADQPYNDSLGLPVVLYPDPRKEPRDAVVAALWSELDAALSGATHVLVIGHSLNDPALLRALRGLTPATGPTAQTGATRLAVSVHSEPDGAGVAPDRPKRTKEVEKALSGATVIPGVFRDKPFFNAEPFERWLSGTAPAMIRSAR